MSDFYTTCMVSNQTIFHGDEVVAFMLAPVSALSFLEGSKSLYTPIALPMYGRYENYGRVNLAIDEVVYLNEKIYNVTNWNETQSKMLTGQLLSTKYDLEQISNTLQYRVAKQLDISEDIKLLELAVKNPAKPVSFGFILADVYAHLLQINVELQQRLHRQFNAWEAEIDSLLQSPDRIILNEKIWEHLDDNCVVSMQFGNFLVEKFNAGFNDLSFIFEYEPLKKRLIEAQVCSMNMEKINKFYTPQMIKSITSNSPETNFVLQMAQRAIHQCDRVGGSLSDIENFESFIEQRRLNRLLPETEKKTSKAKL